LAPYLGVVIKIYLWRQKTRVHISYILCCIYCVMVFNYVDGTLAMTDGRADIAHTVYFSAAWLKFLKKLDKILIKLLQCLFAIYRGRYD